MYKLPFHLNLKYTFDITSKLLDRYICTYMYSYLMFGSKCQDSRKSFSLKTLDLIEKESSLSYFLLIYVFTYPLFVCSVWGKWVKFFRLINPLPHPPPIQFGWWVITPTKKHFMEKKLYTELKLMHHKKVVSTWTNYYYMDKRQKDTEIKIKALTKKNCTYTDRKIRSRTKNRPRKY